MCNKGGRLRQVNLMIVNAAWMRQTHWVQGAKGERNVFYEEVHCARWLPGESITSANQRKKGERCKKEMLKMDRGHDSLNLLCSIAWLCDMQPRQGTPLRGCLSSDTLSCGSWTIWRKAVFSLTNAGQRSYSKRCVVRFLKDLKAIFTHVDNLDNEYEGREVCRETKTREREIMWAEEDQRFLFYKHLLFTGF